MKFFISLISAVLIICVCMAYTLVGLYNYGEEREIFFNKCATELDYDGLDYAHTTDRIRNICSFKWKESQKESD